MQDSEARLYIDDLVVASAPASFVQGPPVVWRELSGEFYANANFDTYTVKVYFTSLSSYMVAQWGVDNVALTLVPE